LGKKPSVSSEYSDQNGDAKHLSLQNDSTMLTDPDRQKKYFDGTAPTNAPSNNDSYNSKSIINTMDGILSNEAASPYNLEIQKCKNGQNSRTRSNMSSNKGSYRNNFNSKTGIQVEDNSNEFSDSSFRYRQLPNSH
jgi:hypothetical protein